MSVAEYEMGFGMIKKADKFLWNKFIHFKNKWGIDNRDKHIQDNGSYPHSPKTDD